MIRDKSKLPLFENRYASFLSDHLKNDTCEIYFHQLIKNVSLTEAELNNDLLNTTIMLCFCKALPNDTKILIFKLLRLIQIKRQNVLPISCNSIVHTKIYNNCLYRINELKNHNNTVLITNLKKLCIDFELKQNTVIFQRAL